MTADEIRHDSQQGFGDPVGSQESATIFFLAEIAAQLAELNHLLQRLADGRKELAVLATIQHP